MIGELSLSVSGGIRNIFLSSIMDLYGEDFLV